MRKCLFHIGLENTGTTTIQHAILASLPELRRAGYHVPKLLENFGHAALAAYGLEDHKHDKICDQCGRGRGEAAAFRAGLIEKIREEFGGTRENIFLSNEHCSSRLVSTSEVQRLGDLLLPQFDQVDIVLYVRRQDDYFRSYISTCVKNRVHIPDLSELRLSPERFDYLRLADLWGSVFGRENISIYAYNSQSVGQKGIVADFAERTGLPLTDTAARRNSGLCVTKLVTLNEINRHLNSLAEQYAERMRRWCLAWPAAGQQPEVDLVTSEIIMGKFADSNRELINEFGLKIEPEAFAPQARAGEPLRQVGFSDFIELLAWVAQREPQRPDTRRPIARVVSKMGMGFAKHLNRKIG